MCFDITTIKKHPIIVFFITTVIVSLSNACLGAYADVYDMPVGYTSFVDKNFYRCVAEEFVKEFPDEVIPVTGLTDEQLAKITDLTCINRGTDYIIADPTGIEKMVNLVNFDFEYQNGIISLDFSNNPKLKKIKFDGWINESGTYSCGSGDSQKSDLTSINVSKNTSLEELTVFCTKIPNINISNNAALTYLNVGYSKLDSIDVSNNLKLRTLYVYGGRLTSLDVSKNVELEDLRMNYNNISSFDASNNKKLKSLHTSDNKLEYLDISNNKELINFSVDDILVQTNIPLLPNDTTLLFDLSAVRFLKDYHNIENTDYYSYDSSKKLLSVYDLDGANGYVQIDGRPHSASTFKLILSVGDADNEAGTDVGLGVPNTGAGTSIDIVKSVMVTSLTITGFVAAYFVIIKRQRNKEHRKFD